MRRRRLELRRIFFVVLLLMAGAATLMSGCGGLSSSTSTPQTYNLTVTAEQLHCAAHCIGLADCGVILEAVTLQHAPGGATRLRRFRKSTVPYSRCQIVAPTRYFITTGKLSRKRWSMRCPTILLCPIQRKMISRPLGSSLAV